MSVTTLKVQNGILNFKPGLVGIVYLLTHYLSHYAKKLKFETKITLAARKTNNFMEEFIFKKIIY